jgi:hypothetical protein
MSRVFLLLIAAAAFAAGPAPDYAKEGKRWWSHIQVLADDNMEGRNTGSPGHKRAAEFVAAEFERAGLKAAGTSGYIQPVKFRSTEIVEDHCMLAITAKGQTTVLNLGEDATLGVREGLAANIDAPAVFVGYGLVIPEYKFDDFAGLDLKGKIIVQLAGGPKEVPSAMRAHYSSRGERSKAVQKTGAIGVVEIQNPKSMDIPWARQTLARLNATMALADPSLEETRGMQFNARINPAHADKIFAASGHTFEEILSASDAGQPLPHFPLNINFRAKTEYRHADLESQNVVGIFTGSDPKLKDEYVVYSAHLDHVGVGQPINGDKIYNGAMDDASGVASLIEIATLLKEQKAKPKRSIVFVAVTGEEKGLLGSRYYATHPTVPGKAIVADINMDMYLPLFPLKYLEVQGLTESTLGDDIREICKKAGIETQADKEPDRNLFIRSDQYNFIREGVPSLAFKFGYADGSPEEKTAKTWLKERYHAPSDDLNQPVDAPAAAQFNRLMLALGERVADTPERPQWKQDSFFRRFVK